MVLLHGMNFHAEKLVRKGLLSFFGLGQVKASQMMAKYSLHQLAKMGSLSPRTITLITAELSQLTIGNDAKKAVQENIKRLRDMGSWRGRRHAMGLPVRGQRTRTQTSTSRKFNRVERTH